MPCVSVVIPSYNAARFLPETIASIQDQDFEDFEIIVVDDCSTDNTREVLKDLEHANLRYFCLKENHGGPSKARNKGIQEAKGEFIAFCDSDDLFVSGRLKSAVNFFRNCPELAMVFTDEQKFDSNTGKILGNFLEGYTKFHKMPKKKIKENFFVILPDDAFSCLFLENYIMPSGVTVRRQVFESVGKFDENLANADDWDMWFRITRKFSIGFIDSIGCRYRVRKNSISSRGSSLAYNRLNVLKKQLDIGLPFPVNKLCKKNIACHYSGIGYSCRSAGRIREAQAAYIKSLRIHFTTTALKGLLISLLGKKVNLIKRYNIHG